MHSRPYVYPYQPAVQTVPAITSYTPSVYSADPGFFVQLPAGGGKYLPDVFGWERGSEYYKKWLGCPTALCKNRVKWRTNDQTVQTVPPQVSYVQAAPQVRTVYTADPMFFNFGRYFNNNLGGKVIVSLINTCMLEIHK